MDIAQELRMVVASLQTLATALNAGGDSTGARVLEDNANRLDSVIAECEDCVMVKVEYFGSDDRYAQAAHIPSKYFATSGEGDDERGAVAALQALLDQKAVES